MGLSDDQKAILRLLAQRGEQGYGDLAALMGIGTEQVHAKALEAAAQLEAEGIPAPAIPPPPGAPADAEPASVTPEVPAAPAAEEPASPPEKPPTAAAERPLQAVETQPSRPAAASRARKPSRARPDIRLPSGGGARAALAAGLVVVVALIVVLVLSGGDDSGGTAASGGSEPAPTAANTAGTNAKEVTKAVLSPVAGGEGAGVAIFGRVKNSVVLEVAAEGLKPTANGESYAVWLSQSPQKMLPLATTKVGGNGQIGSQVELPAQVLGFLANETFGDIAITRVADKRLQTSLKAATNAKREPDYTGTEVLRGTVTGPIVGAAKRQAGSG